MVTLLKAATPETAEAAADRLHGMAPSVRVTAMPAEMDRWTGFSRVFTHLHIGLPAGDPRAVLADATSLGLTRRGPLGLALVPATTPVMCLA